MTENAPNQSNSNPGEYDLAQLIQESVQWMQQQLAEQGIAASPEEAQELFEQKIIHSAKRWMQQDLAEQGIHVSPDEAVAIQKLHLIHLMMERTVTTDPDEAP